MFAYPRHSTASAHLDIRCAFGYAGRLGIDIERVNTVISYDIPVDGDLYLHRVDRAGRFETEHLAATFVDNEESAGILKKVQERLEVNVRKMPASVDTTFYLNA